MKLIIWAGFILHVVPCTLAFDSLNGVEGHDGMASSD